VFERGYFSSWSHRDGPLGRGWSHSLDLALWFEGDLAIFRNGEGQEIVFVLPVRPVRPDLGRTLEIDQEVFEPISGDTLARKRDGWVVITARGIIHRFAASAGHVARPSGRPGATQVGLGYATTATGGSGDRHRLRWPDDQAAVRR
jgi:hypothetical protein